jgi:hypothetical protein
MKTPAGNTPLPVVELGLERLEPLQRLRVEVAQRVPAA